MENTPVTPDWQQVAANLRKQLLIERAAIAVILLLLISKWAYGYLAASCCTVYADGKAIVTVENSRVAHDLQQELLDSVPANADNLGFAQHVQIKRTRTARPLDRDSALAVLKDKLTVQGDKWAVLIDGRPYAAVDTKDQAGEVMELARQKYGRLATNLLEEPSFKQNVTIELQPVDLRKWRRTPQEAVELLFAPDGKATVHVVKKGQIASGIGEDYHMTLAEMKKLNPGRSLDKLQIGDRLRVGQGKSPLTVIVQDQVKRTELMPFRTESITTVKMYAGKQITITPGVRGKRDVTLAVTYENGIETGREVLDEEIIRQPVPKRIAIGVKPRR